MIETSIDRTIGRQRFRVSKNAEDEDKRTDFKEKMLNFNHPEGLLTFETDRLNERKYYDYDITGKESAAEVFAANKPQRGQLAGMLSSVLKIAMGLSEYMLDEGDLMITPEAIFIGRSGEVGLVYLPGYGQPLKDQLCQLGQYLMDRIDYHDESAVVLAYKFYMRTKDADCTASDLLTLIGSEKDNEGNAGNAVGNSTGSRTDIRSHGTIGGMEADPSDEVREITTGPSPNRRSADERGYGFADIMANADSGTRFRGRLAIYITILMIAALQLARIAGMIPLTAITSVFLSCIPLPLTCAYEYHLCRLVLDRMHKNRSEEEEPTVLLYDSRQEQKKYMLVSNDLENICPSHFPYYVGKDEQRVDHVIRSKGVSRYHLKLETEGGGLTVTDLNSTNGTWVNGEKLAPHKAVTIKTGDEIRIADNLFYCN